MKNKREKKSLKKSSDILMNKSTKIILLIVSIITAIFLLMVLFTFLVSDFSKIFWYYIRNPINDFLFKIFQFFPFITDNYLNIFVTIIVLSGIIVILINYIKVPQKKRKQFEIIINIFNKVLIIVIFLALMQILLTLSDYNHPNINSFFMNSHIENKYTEDDLFDLLKDLSNIVLRESKLFDRDNGDVIVQKDVIERVARKDLINISDSYPFLKGSYPQKTKNVSNNSYVYGYTNNYSISTDKSINNLNYASVIAHEYCHFKGILHESDAIYCAYLSGTNSYSLLSRYSAHLEAFSWVMSVAEKCDEDKTNKIVEEILNLCLNDNYREVCDLQIKNIYRYQENSNMINLSSYVLDTYHNHLDEFINILDTYLNDYNALLLIDGSLVSLMDVRNSIVSDEFKTLQVVIKNDEETFKRVTNLLKSTNRYFKAIRQQNSNYQSQEVNSSYYLNPFSNQITSIFEDDLYNDYAYPRVVRLLLEHRSAYGIK